VRVLERVVSVITVAAFVLWAAYLVVVGSDAGVPFFPALIVLGCGGAAVLLLWVLRMILHLVSTRHARERRRVRRLVAEPMVLLVCLAFVLSGAAFWVRFMLSRSSLNHYVAAFSNGTRGSSGPAVRVGLFWLRDTEVLPQGAVRMITTECGVVDTCGVVYSPTGRPPVIGEDVYESLGGPWYHCYRRF